MIAASAEQDRDAPKSGQPHKGINDAAENSGLSAEDPRNQVELCNAHKSPVNSANDGEDQGNRIHTIPPYLYLMGIVCT